MVVSQKKGRKAEVERIRQANRAAAVGRLMLGELSDWADFMEADTLDLKSLPRRQLKAGAADVKKRVSKEINRFCARNFENMTTAKLSLLYKDIKAHRGTEIPLKDFEQNYSKVHKSVLKGYPPHCTVVISLWGLQFKFPEDYLSKDVCEALLTASNSNKELHNYKKYSHRKVQENREIISSLTRKESHAVRSCLLCCFNLVEAYLNGIAWDFEQDEASLRTLSKRQQSLIHDLGHTSLRDKIIKYPKIITGRHLWDETDDVVSTFLEVFKPFRDSLVHPSPFSAPERFGGYDKLSKFYRIDFGITLLAAKTTSMLITRIHRHLTDLIQGHPNWLKELLQLLDETIEITADGKPI